MRDLKIGRGDFGFIVIPPRAKMLEKKGAV